MQMSGISFAAGETTGLVSIVIPTYRKERFIGETLASVGWQTYPKWELLVVEDSSTSAEPIVAEFARRFPNHRIEYSRNDRNRGASYSRNVAFAKSAGEFVALLDSDDRWFPEHLACSVGALHASGKDLVYSSTVMIEDQTDLLLDIGGPKSFELAEFPGSIMRRNFITPSATVMRRQVLADVGAWDTTWLYCEDLDFWMRCIQAGKQFQIIGGCHCLYRKNHEGATTQKESGTLEEFADIVAKHQRLPGVRESVCRRHIAKAYVRAAHCHANGSIARDPSADPARSAMLMRKALQFRPNRLDYIWQAALFAAKNKFRSAPRPTAATIRVADPPARAAA
jgi:GT2 family glycosyltransferase